MNTCDIFSPPKPFPDGTIPIKPHPAPNFFLPHAVIKRRITRTFHAGLGDRKAKSSNIHSPPRASAVIVSSLSLSSPFSHGFSHFARARSLKRKCLPQILNSPRDYAHLTSAKIILTNDPLYLGRGDFFPFLLPLARGKDARLSRTIFANSAISRT